MMAESVVPNTTNGGDNHGTKAPSAPGSPMAAEPPLAAAAPRVPNSTGNDESCDAVATLKAKLAAKERDVAETTAKVDDLTARLAGLEESMVALRKEKESELANIVGEKDKRIAELEAALAAKGRDDDDDAGPSTNASAPTSRRVKAVSSKALLGRNSPFATSTPINKGKAKAKVVRRSSLAELNAAAADDDDDERERPAPKKAARPSRGRSGRMPSSNERLGHSRGKKKERRPFDVEAYKNPTWSEHAFFKQYKIKSKEDLIAFILAYKKRAHRGPLEEKHTKWYPRASKYEAEDFLRLLDNKNTEGKYKTGNIASLVAYFGEDEGEDFGKGKDMPYYNRAHRVASLLFSKWPVTSDRTTFDVHTSDRDSNTGDAYIFERARKFCTALNTVATLHDIYTGEMEDVVPWKEGDPLTKPAGKKRARRPANTSAAGPSTKRRSVPSVTDDDDSEAEEAEGEDSEDEDEGEDDDDSSSGESAAPNEEEVAKYAEECLAEGAKKDSYDAALDHWYAKYPKGKRNGPEPPWVANEAWGHELRDRNAEMVDQAPAPVPEPTVANADDDDDVW